MNGPLCAEGGTQVNDVAAPRLPATASLAGVMDLWGRVDELVSPARSLRDLRTHHLQVLAADYWCRIAFPVPENLLLEERNFRLRHLAVDALRLRNAVDTAC